MNIIKKRKYSLISVLAKYSFVFIIAFTLVTNVAFALCPDGTDANPCPDGTDANTISTKINNPLGEKLTTIPAFIHEVVQIVLVVGIPIIALAIIYTGFLFVTAQGNSEKITKAKKALMYVLVGAALLLGAFVIANAIQATVDQIKS